VAQLFQSPQGGNKKQIKSDWALVQEKKEENCRNSETDKQGGGVEKRRAGTRAMLLKSVEGEENVVWINIHLHWGVYRGK